MKIERGQTKEVVAAGMASSGDGIAHLGDVQVHIPGLLMHEKGRVRIEHVSRQQPRAFATLLEIIEPAAERRSAACLHQGDCSGCPLMVAPVAKQREQKRIMLKEQFGIEVDEMIPAPCSEAYRWSSKRVVGGKRGRVRLGSYQRDSHRLAEMDRCLVDHPDIVASVQEIQAAASAAGIEPYDESRQSGDLRYVWLKTNGSGEVLITLITRTAESRVAELAAALHRPSGVAHCVQASTGNAIRGDDLRLLSGVATLTVEFLGEMVQIGPLGFLQPNPEVAAMAYRDLLGEHRGAVAFDLYAGLGLTTRILKKRYECVMACESYPESAAALGLAPQTVEEFLLQQRAQEPTPQPELIIANPPRSGLGPRVCQQLNELASLADRPVRLHIMSCKPAAMARDLSQLREGEGRFRMLSARAYDTLPHTPHVELVVQLNSV